MFETWAYKDLSLTAICTAEKLLSYQDLLERIHEFATYFKRQGIRKEDRVAFVAETNISSVYIFFALLEIGASACLLSTRIPEENISLYLNRARASFFLNSENFSIQKLQDISFQESFILLFTSGSSGVPKLASLKVDHFLESSKGAIERLGLKSKKGCWLLSLPLFHVSGLSILFRCFLSGSSIAFTSDILKGHELVTHLSLVPTQLLRILDKIEAFPRLKCALVGGAPISKELVRLSLKKNIPLYLTYGMTETASLITVTSYQDLLIPIHAGKPLPGKEIKIAKDGEILVKGSSLFSGYDTENGLEIPLKNGWFATGDLGDWNAHGNLEYKGRKDNLFISGGENIHPEMIEKALGEIPGVLGSLVVPIEDEEFGERPIAFVEMKTLLDKETFHQYLRPHLPKFCLPVYFFPFPEESKKNIKFKRAELKIWAKEFFLQKM